MKRLSFTVQNAAGLHARPAAQLVSCAKGFESAISLHAAGESCDAKSIFSVIALDVTQGAEVTLVIEGKDEEQAEAALALLSEEL